MELDRMSEEDVRTEICEALTKEITALRQSAESLYFAFDRVFNFGLVFVLGVVGLSLTRTSDVLIFAAFPAIALALIYMNLNAEGLSRAGHKKYLEERLNELLGSEVYLEERYVAPTRWGATRVIARASVFGTQLMLATLLIGLTASGGTVVVKYGALGVVTYWIATGLSLALVARAFVEILQAYSRAYEGARSAGSRSTSRYSSDPGK